MAREKIISLDDAIASIEKAFGKGSIMRLDGDNPIRNIATIPTGCAVLDTALGIGGYPRGRIVEVIGQESSGKTTLSLHAIAEAQAAGGTAAFIDAEHALDVNYAKKLGVKTDEVLISQPDCGEQALEIADTLVRSGAVDIIVIDSVAALVPKTKLKNNMGDHHIGLQARLMSQALRKMSGNVSRTNTVVIFINQIRHKIGVMFGNPETTTGGNALKFYASIRLDIRRIGAVKQGDQAVGNRTCVRVVKNKLAPPFKEAKFDIIYGDGISKERSIIDMGLEAGVLEKAGAWITFNTERIGNGIPKATAALKEKPELVEAIIAAIDATKAK